MLVAQLSDTHVCAPGELACGRVDTAEALRRCVAAVAELAPPPDLVVITGDLTEAGTAAEYDHLRALLAGLPCPFLLIPGNHDDRTLLVRSFPDHPWMRQMEGFVQFEASDWPLRILALDTVASGRPHGELCPSRLRWLGDRLAEQRERPTLVLMHHPPFATGISFMDAIGLRTGAPDLERLVADNPQIQRITCGHLHRAIETRFGGTLAGCCPSPAHKIPLDLRPAAPAAFVLEPGGFQLHRWLDGRLVTHTAVVGHREGPFLYG